jgi:GR25 family glycosyltransferase involved in LPS biosynthesis
MAIPVVVLNLKSSAVRRAQISGRLDALAIEHRFFDAIDGRLLSVNEIERLAPQSALLFDRRLTPREIGCTATHLGAIRQLAAGDHDFACTMEDDAVPASADIVRFLEPETLAALPPFDVLRLVSDPARWKMPAWQIAQIHGRGIYAMSRPGWGLQGQIFSREGLRKIASQISTVRAPADFVLYHDCHVRGLRVLEIRPGLIEHDMKEIHTELQALSDIGFRAPPDKAAMSLTQRMNRKLLRWRRKRMAARCFVEVWGVGGLLRVLSWWPPGAYFR